MSDRWNSGTFLAKVKELVSRLGVWDIEDGKQLVQLVSIVGSWRWKRKTFRQNLQHELVNPRPKPGYVSALCDTERGKVIEAATPPIDETDRSLTVWLLGDFKRHLDAASTLPATSLLAESFEQFLDLPLYTTCEPYQGLQRKMEDYRCDEHGEPMCLMVTGRKVPTEILDRMMDAAEKLFATAPSDWGAFIEPVTSPDVFAFEGEHIPDDGTEESCVLLDKTNEANDAIEEPPSSSTLGEILAREHRREAIKREMSQLHATYQLRMNRVHTVWNRIYATVPSDAELARGAAAFSSSKREGFADALLAFCDVARQEGFNRGIDVIVQNGVLNNNTDGRIAAEIIGFGWQADREALLGLMEVLEGIRRQCDNMDTNAASQEGIWKRVRGLFDLVVGNPHFDVIPPWHQDGSQFARLNAELKNLNIPKQPQDCDSEDNQEARPHASTDTTLISVEQIHDATAVNNPFSDLLTVADKFHEEESKLLASLGGKRREDIAVWGPRMQARIAKLEELSAAALIEADHTGFAIEEVERRLNDFVAATRPILVWQRDAPFLSSDEQQKSIKSCTWHDPASDYLIEHYNRFLTARDPVNTLAILLDGHIKRKRKPDSPPKEPDHSRSASGPGLDSQSVQTVKPNEQPQKTPEFSTNPRLSSNRPIKQPSPDAIAAYRAQLTTGMNQKELAEMLSKELGRLVYQGTVSRWLNHVKTWIEAGNVLPDITKPLNTRPTAMDPREIDLGPRQDGRAARQRERRNSDGQD